MKTARCPWIAEEISACTGECCFGQRSCGAALPLRIAGRKWMIAGRCVLWHGDWPENGFGNHRAVVDVAAADAVRARIPWRRHDAEFRGKAVLVYDLATGAKIENVFACNITREYGDVVFQPQTVPGRYAIYYMPYQHPATTSGEWNGSYLPPRLVAEPAWLAKHGLSVSASAERHPLPRFPPGG